MHPVLLKIGVFEIHAYGLTLALSFLLGIYWAMHRAPKRNIEQNMIMDLSLIVVFCAIIGSRLMYVVTHLEEFKGHWLDTINPIQGNGVVGISGLSMLGGVLLVLVAVLVFSALKKVSVIKLCDVMAPSFALGIALTRIGCFFNGCCFGEPCDLPWGVAFPPESPAGYIHQGVHIHPTQLYSSLYGLVILIVIWLLDRKPRFSGFIMSVFFILYGTARFLVDFVRYYETSVQFKIAGNMMTFNQAISIGMVVAGIVLMIFLQRKAVTGE